MEVFPRWVHHKEHKDKLVHSAQDLKSLGEGWGNDSSVWREKSESIAIEELQGAEVAQLPAPAIEEQKKMPKKGKQKSA